MLKTYSARVAAGIVSKKPIPLLRLRRPRNVSASALAAAPTRTPQDCQFLSLQILKVNESLNCGHYERGQKVLLAVSDWKMSFNPDQLGGGNRKYLSQSHAPRTDQEF